MWTRLVFYSGELLMLFNMPYIYIPTWLVKRKNRKLIALMSIFEKSILNSQAKTTVLFS